MKPLLCQGESVQGSYLCIIGVKMQDKPHMAKTTYAMTSTTCYGLRALCLGKYFTVLKLGNLQ